ncbi:MAG TPA: SDR family oxidoreductase [Chloroflexota bacterium]
MGPSLKDKVAIVTDIGSESGQAIAARFVAEGAQVGGCRGAGVRAEPIPKTLPDGVLALEGDIGVVADAQRMVDTVVQRFGRLDILVNHGAGGRLVGTVLDAKEEDLREVMAGDVWSVIALSAAAIPAMRKVGGGSIVNIASIARLGLSQRPLRSASQAALGALTRSMAIDHAADNIRVNSLLLGPTLTPNTPPAQREQWEKTDPMHKVATPEDIAAGTLFLASDESRVLTGALIPLDAGRSLPNW